MRRHRLAIGHRRFGAISAAGLGQVVNRNRCLHPLKGDWHSAAPAPGRSRLYPRLYTSVLAAIFHVVEHFSGHTYQVILPTKRATREDLGFYSYLARTGRKEAEPDTKEHGAGQ